MRAFIPPPLPPELPVELAPLQSLLEQANQSLGRLDGLASILPDVSLLIYMYNGGRKIDLVNPKYISSRLRERILAEAQLQYGEG